MARSFGRAVVGVALVGLLAEPGRAGTEADGPPAVDLFAHGDGVDSGAEAEVVAEPTGPAAQGLGEIPPAVLEAAVQARGLPLAERMEAVSEPLLGQPYVADPLGEGTGYDPEPLARYDAFDCLTWVEEVLALSLAGDPAHSAPIRLGLRYEGQPSYPTRRHFMELQWIPAAQRNGWLRDTTADYGEAAPWEREVTLGVWKAWSRRSLFALTDEQLPLGTMRLQVLPIEAAIEAAPRIRPGSIVMAVREDRSWIPLRITHLGFVVPGDGEPMFRHATRMSSGQLTRDHKLSWYLEHLATYVHWKTTGITVFEPIEPGPRIGRVPPGWEGPGALVLLPDGREAVATR